MLEMLVLLLLFFHFCRVKASSQPTGLSQRKRSRRRNVNYRKKINEQNEFLFFQLIHSAAPQSWPVVIIIFTHVVHSSVSRPLIFKASKTKQISSKNNINYWWDCGSGRVDHFFNSIYFECTCVYFVFSQCKFNVKESYCGLDFSIRVVNFWC